MNTIYIVPIEPIDQRYTKQWYENIPVLLAAQAQGKFNVVTIDGIQTKTGTTQGAFLDFAVTNIYKASQAETIARKFAAGEIQAGDRFLVTDAWNPVITSIRYMSDLLDIPVEIHGIWHAGAYDPTDILGMKMSKPWPWHQERAWFYACDVNYYATNFHLDMFVENLTIPKDTARKRAMRSGQPHDPIVDQLTQYQSTAKQATVIWPHRYNADKQPEIAEDLAQDLDFVITQKMNLSKPDYYRAMGQASVIFSCALHENLGISVMEGTLAGAIPAVPNRASYAEMYMDEFLYPSEWTSSWDNYLANRDNVHNFIHERIRNREKYLTALQRQQRILIDNYLNANIMLDRIVR